jgi:hypothetical protein
LEDDKHLLEYLIIAGLRIIFFFDQNKIQFRLVFYLMEDTLVCNAICEKQLTGAENFYKRKLGPKY